MACENKVMASGKVSHSMVHTCVSITVDGHHKLIRWKIVTHAAIDGYSRMIVFMKCSNNNKATTCTVYNHFLEAILNYGLPSRVRSDQGRENCLVAQHMLEHRGEARGSMITGSSVHNQRYIHYFYMGMLYLEIMYPIE